MSTRRTALSFLALLGIASATASLLGSPTAARQDGSAPVRGHLEPAACSGPNTGIGGWVGLYYADTLCVTMPGGSPVVSVVATLAGASSCGIIGAEFEIAAFSGHGMIFYPVPGVTVDGDCLDDGCRLTFACSPSGPGQRITLGEISIDAAGYPSASLSGLVGAPVAPLNPAMPYANFTRCDGQIVVMQHADSTTTSPVSLWCPNASDEPVLSYVTTQIARPDVDVSMDIVAANPMNPMTLLARLRKAGHPDIHMTAIDMVSPGRIAVTFPTAGAATGGWNLVVSTEAGVDSLLGALVLYDDPLPLTRSVSSATTGAEIAVSGALSQFDSLAYTSGFTMFVKGIDALDTGNSRVVVTGNIFYQLASPTWSPGGDRLAFTGKTWWTTTSQAVRATGANTGTEFNGVAPAWSPLTDRLAFVDDLGEEAAVYTTNTSGQVWLQLSAYTPNLAGEGAHFPAWSPDAARVSFTRNDSILSVSAALGEAAGTHTLAVLTDPERHSWSPDGRWVAYSDTRTGNTDVFVRGTRETQYGEYRLTTSAAADRNPVWTRDGNRIAFVSTRSGTSNVYLVSSLPFRADADADYVLDSADGCPAAGLPPLGKVDRNFDGCADVNSSFRNTRFWSADRVPFHYEIHPDADPRITNGSDITALTAAVASWAPVVGFTPVRDTPADIPANAVSGDGRNTITFMDPDPIRGGYLAISMITSVVGSDTMIGGTWYRPGEIVDADILFNTRYAFMTPSYPGLGQADLFDLQSLAAHEVGHVLGLAHSSIKTATMYWAIPRRDTSFRSLAVDDVTLAARAYGSPAVNASGTIYRPDGSTPIPGAGVLAIATATGDTVQMTTTGIDGQYSIVGVTQDFRIRVQPVDGGPEIGGLKPAAVGPDFATVAATNFAPEYWDGAGETNADGGPGLVVTAPGPTMQDADVIIDADVTGPSVVAFTPANGSTDVPVSTAVAAMFSDRIDATTVQANVSLLRDGLVVVGGAAGLLQRDSLVVFTSTSALQYSTSYTLSIGPGIRDRAGNLILSAASAMFTTQAQPALQLIAVAPAEVPVLSPIVLEGAGFSSVAAQDTVRFTTASGTIATPATRATPTRLYVTVPNGAVSGNVTVTTNSMTSNAIPITIVASRQAPTISALGNAGVPGVLRSLAVSAGGAWAYVGSSTGVFAVDADPSSEDFLAVIPVAAGDVTAVVALGDGRRAVAVGPTQPRFRLIETHLVNGTHEVLATANLVDEPRGLAALTNGNVLVAHTDRVVQLSTTAGVNPGQEVRAWSGDEITFQGNLAVTGDGTLAYAATTDGRIGVLDLLPGDNGVAVGFPIGSTAPREIAVAPAGGRFYTVDENGVMRIGDDNGNVVKHDQLNGGFKALAISPEGELAYVADFVHNEVEVVNIQSNNLMPVSRFSTGRDPVDIATGTVGRYVYVIANGRLWVYDTESGPRVLSVSPRAGAPGTLITIHGTGFNVVPANNLVEISGVPHTPLPVYGGSRLVVVQGSIASGPIRVTTGGVPSNEVEYGAVSMVDAPVLAPEMSVRTLGLTTTRCVMSPNGERLVARGSGHLWAFDMRDGVTMHQLRQHMNNSQTNLSSSDGAMAVTPDGTMLFAMDVSATRIRMYNIAAQSEAYTGPDPLLTYIGNVRVAVGDETIPNPREMVISPDGRYLFVRVQMGGQPRIWTFSVATNLRVATLTPMGLSTSGSGLVFHPDGSRLYVGGWSGGGRVLVYDVGGGSAGPLISTIVVAGEPDELHMDPDGSKLLAVTLTSVVVIGTDPSGPDYHQVRQTLALGTGSGSRSAVMNASGSQLYVAVDATLDELVSVRCDGPTVAVNGLRNVSTFPASLAMSLDDMRLYHVGGTELRLATMPVIPTLTLASEPALLTPRATLVPSPFAVRAAPGQIVRFSASSAQFFIGVQATPFFSSAWDIADANGFARSPAFSSGTTSGNQVVTALVPNWPTPQSVNFQVSVLADTTGPPVMVATNPHSTASPGVQTTIAVDFSKSIQRATVNVAGLTLRDAGAVLPVEYAFLNRDRRIQMLPQVALIPGRTYTIQYDSALKDQAGAALANPGIQSFTVSATPSPLELRAIWPPAARLGDPVTLSGSGFGTDASVIEVRFGDVTTQPTFVDAVSLRTYVPLGAATGQVRVMLPSDSTNTADFTVLLRGESPRNDVIGSITAPASGHYIAIVPDGSRSYMTCPGAGTVVPMVIATRVAEAPIPVGLHPFGVASAPDGAFVYVTNFLSDEL